jgi:hypothetical protein|tara:strand:+ start:1266 stop:1487 length:222 start_codon:yes stop_codon:yes gene_type:complete
MKCECCDSTLSDAELTIKSATTGLFLNACVACLSLMEGIEYTCENDITLELGTNIALYDYIDYEDNTDFRYNQ